MFLASIPRYGIVGLKNTFAKLWQIHVLVRIPDLVLCNMCFRRPHTIVVCRQFVKKYGEYTKEILTKVEA